MSLLALLFVVASQNHVTVRDSVHTRLSRIVQSTITDELRSRAVVVGENGDYLAEIVDASDRSGHARQTQIVRDMKRAVEVTEIVGGAAAEVRLYDSTHALVATYRLSGSGSSSASVGARKGNVLAFIVAPLLERSRSAEAARAIGHDIAGQIAIAITPLAAPDTPPR